MPRSSAASTPRRTASSACSAARSDGGVITAADRRDRSEYRVLAMTPPAMADDELVVAEELPSRRFGKRARILERLGPADAPGAISRLIIAAYDIPAEFPAAALAEAEAAPAVRPRGSARSARAGAGHDRRQRRARFR